MRNLVSIGALGLSAMAFCQIPDLVNALDAGTRNMGSGGVTVTDATTQSALSNPAGLGFVRENTFGVAYRNLPRSQVQIARDLDNPDFAVSRRMGDRSATHFGIAIPLRRGDGATSGAFGISYTTLGYLNNLTTGNNLATGDLVARNYREEIELRTDAFTLSYGRPMSGRMNWGAGIVVANTSVTRDLSFNLFDAANNDRGSVNQSVDGTGNGIGGVVGITINDEEAGRYTYGLSLRTPIRLSGNEVGSVYRTVPGAVSAGGSFLVPGLGGGQDYAVAGLQANYFFGGSASSAISRTDTFTLGAGLEYNLFRFGGRIPLRVGLNVIPSGGDFFSDRNAFTFGVGYYPQGQTFGFDVGFAAPTGGGPNDIAFGLVFRGN